MSFQVVHGDQRFYVDFNHKHDTGTTCCIWEDQEDREWLVAYGKTTFYTPKNDTQKPDTLNKVFGRKLALKRALDQLYVKQGMSRPVFREFRAAVYKAMFEKCKICETDMRFKHAKTK